MTPGRLVGIQLFTCDIVMIAGSFAKIKMHDKVFDKSKPLVKYQLFLLLLALATSGQGGCSRWWGKGRGLIVEAQVKTPSPGQKEGEWGQFALSCTCPSTA